MGKTKTTWSQSCHWSKDPIKRVQVALKISTTRIQRIAEGLISMEHLFTPEMRKIRSQKYKIAKTGHVVPKEVRNKIRKKLEGRKNTVEVREKKSFGHLGKCFITPKGLEKLSFQMRGNLNPNWKGGIRYLPYTEGFDYNLKLLIKKAFCYRCVLCREEKKGKRQLSIHHVDGNKQNDLLNNLIPLCRKCHGMMGGQRYKEYIFYFQGILNDYTWSSLLKGEMI